MGILDRLRRQPTMDDLAANLQKEGTITPEQRSLLQSNPYLPVTTQPVNPPVLSPVSWETGKLVDLQMQLLNRYNQGDALFQMDERIFSAVDLMATMIKKSYVGVALKPEEKGEGDLTQQEQNILDDAQKLADSLDFGELFYSYTHDLFKYGDVVDLIQLDLKKGVTALLPLPLNYITAIDNIQQFRQVLPLNMNVVNDPKYYIVDELNTRYDVADKLYLKDQILHISFHNRRNWVRDNIGRWTFNVWSHAPILTLRVLIEWKQTLIRNDMLWRNRSVPREHHKLDLSVYDPSKYSGDFKTKISNATADAQAAINTYSQAIQRREADQGFITDNNTAIEIVEPKAANYQSPNELINQINQLISAPTGTPDALAGGADKGMSALLYSSSFAAMRAEIYGDRIRKALESIIKRHVHILHPAVAQAVIDRLYIRVRLILDRDRGELAKIVAVLTGSKVFTPAEIREVWGVDALTPEQEDQLYEWLQKTNIQKQIGQPGTSPEEGSENFKREGDTSQGPDSNNRHRIRNRNQTGDKVNAPGGVRV